jgi:hypothetical protein
VIEHSIVKRPNLSEADLIDENAINKKGYRLGQRRVTACKTEYSLNKTQNFLDYSVHFTVAVKQHILPS